MVRTTIPVVGSVSASRTSMAEVVRRVVERVSTFICMVVGNVYEGNMRKSGNSEVQ